MARFYHRYSPKLQAGEYAWVFGVVTAVRKSKNVLFFDVLHALGSIQAVVEKDKCKAVKTRDRLKIKGEVGQTQQGERSLFLHEAPSPAGSFLGDTLSATDPDLRLFGASLLVAQARAAAEDYLSKQNYRCVDPRYVSASWQADGGLIPLNVSYPGFGIPVYLAPSPAQQLSLAIAATGDDRVFCSATSFTTSYRQPSDGVETAIVMTKTLGIDLDGLIAHATGLIDAVCGWLPGTKRRYPLGSLQRADRPLSDLVTVNGDGSNSVWVHPVQQDGVQPFRVVLDSGVSPVEGCVEQRPGGIAVGTLVFHLERMLPLAEHVPFRRLRHLGPLPDRQDR